MVPATFILSFELGASGSADFAVPPSLPVDSAVATFRAHGAEAATLTLACAVTAENVVQLRLTPADTAALGQGQDHRWQLDASVGGQALRLAKGTASVAYGLATPGL